MSLQIELLDAPEPVYPGSKISGTVRLTSKTDEGISAVSVAFRGRAKVKLRSSEHYTTRSYRSCAIYFYEEIPLYEGGKYTHKAGTYVWPFAFTVPLEASPQIAENASPSRPKRQLDSMGMLKLDRRTQESPVYDFFSAKPPWRGSKDLRPHPLLDTFSYVQSRWPLDWECRIEYTLYARLQRPSGSFLFTQKELVAKRDLIIKAAAPKDLLSQLQQRQTTQLTQAVLAGRFFSKIDKGTSFVAKTQALLRPSSTSTETFGMTLTTAVCGMLGECIPMTLGRAEDPDQETGCDMKLTAFECSLLIKTTVRDNALTALEQKAEKTDTIALASKKGLEVKIPGQNGDLVEIGHEYNVRLPIDVVPSFATYNIYRGYRLTVELKFDVAGQIVTMTDSTLRIVVLPPQARGIPGIAAPKYEQREGQGENVGSGKTLQQPDKGGEEGRKDEKGGPRRSLPQDNDPEQLPAYQP